MRSLTKYLIFAAFFAIVIANPVDDPVENEPQNDDGIEPIIPSSGGCPDRYSCYRVCRGKGFTTGYCEGFLWMTCICYR